MRLKKIEILGFKSFRDKTHLAFSSGISAIVGPNGCGKSNIVDAMRWAMGEQRVSMLRGKKMEDVIFNGSDDAHPVSMAEVSITLENNGQHFNNAYAECAEVTVTRKIFREGESEYSINNVPCRLLDVREFFMDAGVGARTYSIVEQEKVFHLIEAKPDERREFIEEAAGIAKYRSRKESATRKMEATRQNLLRLHDIVSEVKSQLNAISRQAKKAERFKTLKQSIRESQLLLSLHHLLELKNRQDTLEEELRQLENRRIEGETHQTSLEAAIEEIQSHAAENEAAATSVQERFFNIKNEISTNEQQIEFSRTILADLRKREVANSEEIDALKARRETVAAEIDEWGKTLAASDGTILDTQKHIACRQESVNLLRMEETGIREQLDREKSKHMEAVTENSRLKNLLASLEKDMENLARKREREYAEIAENHKKISVLKERMLELTTGLADQVRETDLLKDRGTACREELEIQRRQLTALNDEIDDLKEQIGMRSSRLHSLKELQESFEWCNEGTRYVLKESRKPSWEGGRVYGLVADQVEVPREYEVAVEAALGEKIQAILVEQHKDGIKAIDYLKHSGTGRGSFIPLEDGRSNEFHRKLPAHLEQAVQLTDVVRPRREELKKFFDRLFGDILVIPDLHTGTELWKQNGFTGTFVTPEGDIVSGNGILTGGSTANGSHSLLRNKREITELQQDINRLQERLEEEQAAKIDAASRIDVLEEELENLRKTFHAQELLISEKKKDIERFEGEISWIDQRTGVLVFNTESMEREEGEAKQRIRESRNEMIRNEARIAGDEDLIVELQEKWKDITARLKEEEQVLVERKINLSSLEERRESGFRSLKNLQDSIAEIDNRIRTNIRDVEACKEKIRAALDESGAAEKRLLTLYADFEQAQEHLSEKRSRQGALDAARKEQESLLQAARKNLDGLSREISRITLDRQEVTIQISALKNGVQERYNEDLQELIPGFEPLEVARKEELERKCTEGKKRLEEFGEVNLLALSEYEELKERHDFMSTQIQDLESSLETLQKTIARINQISRKRFAETFEAVNANFKKVFPRLFPGGKGALHLTDDTDMLETGVDIEIQIPGKKPQNLSLLSGGEKALAAVSLIFAILMYRPTPFLILDEADAPLDDSNVSLFTQMVGDMARESQIIYITHNKRTMETADNLIGVTMQKSGISSIVSVNMQQH